ncbi:hypothetical protein BGZ98_009223 [Dissophora globulifera]|nr:hypothetical protein BGZ98_009223 [Dissophora globulifera]
MSSANGTSEQDASIVPATALFQAFHPVDDKDTITLLSLRVPLPLLDDASQSSAPIKAKKEAFFDICLDVSGSMAGSGINCAKIAMQRLIDHLVNTCNVPPSRITVYLFSHICKVRRLGQDDDKEWFNLISAGGGTDFECVFKAIISNTKANIREIGNADVDVDLTLFFFTDGEDSSIAQQRRVKEELESLLKKTPRLDTTVHTFGFTAGHDAAILSWLTSTGSNDGCFQYIKEAAAIESSMSTTLELLGTTAMQVRRKIEVLVGTDDKVAQDWITVKLESDDVSGSTVVRDRPFGGDVIRWREYQSTTELSTSAANPTHDVHVDWLSEESPLRIIATTTFIQHELLRLAESISSISSDHSMSPALKNTSLLQIDKETLAYSKSLGEMTSAIARSKAKAMRVSCMAACQRTRTLLQSFLTLKADAHKRDGAISNTSLATFNSLAYGQIAEAKLKAKLDSRVGKNMAKFADLDDKVAKIVEGLDLDKLEAQESEDRLRELTCAFSTNSYVEALRDGDCLCMTLDVSRSAGAIADASQLVIKSIFPTFLTSSMFTMALDHSLAQSYPEEVHGGFDRNSDASIAPGLAQENITAVLPLYINKEHWQVAKLRMKPILGYVVTLDATGYTYSQSTTVPFLVLAKALESHPMTEFNQRQIRLILETCDAIYESSTGLRESTKRMVEQFCASHDQRTVDVVTNNYVFLGHVICALRAGDITPAEMAELLPQFETSMVEEQIRRDMSWKVSEDLMGSVSDWLGIDRQRDIVIPGRRYRGLYDEYVSVLEGGSDAAVSDQYRLLFRNARAEQGVAVNKEAELSTLSLSDSPTAVAASLEVAKPNTPSIAAPLEKPIFRVPDFDVLTFELSEASLDRLNMIQNAVSSGVDKILRLLAVVQTPLDADLPHVFSALGKAPPRNKADEFFERYSAKVNLATILQAYAHTKNSDRRSVQNFMTPFESEQRDDDSSAPESLQFLKSMYMAKMTQMVNEIVVAVEEDHLNLKNDAAARTFLGTKDLEVAAGVLVKAKFRGGRGGRLVTQCAMSSMLCARSKIQMLLTGTYKGVRLFCDKLGSEDIRWYPCKRTLFRMFTNYHAKFTLDEW